MYLTIRARGKCFCAYCGSYVDISEFNLNQYEKEKEKAEAQSSSDLDNYQTMSQLQEKLDNESNEQKEEPAYDPTQLYDGFHCESCGAELITDKTTTITRCVFCGSQQMIKQRMVGKFEPKEVIPFKITKEDFIKRYKTFANKKILAPQEYRNNPIIDETKGLYVPYHLFEYNVTSYGRGLAEYRTNDNTQREWFEHKVNNDVLVPVDGSVRLDDNIMSSLEPYDIGEMVKFNPAFITGFQSECTDETDNSLKEKAENRIFAHSVFEIKKKLGKFNQIGGYLVSDMKETNPSKYVLLPVWFVNCKFKDKKYSYALNGQTGKVVGEVPLSKPKFYSLMTLLSMVALFLTIVIILASVGSSHSSSRYYDDDDDDNDGVGKVIALIWSGGVVAPYVAIKKRYKNVSHVFNNSIPFKNHTDKISTIYKRKKEYLAKYPDDDLKKIIYQKYVDGKYSCDINFSQMASQVKAFDKKSVSIDNKNL